MLHLTPAEHDRAFRRRDARLGDLPAERLGHHAVTARLPLQRPRYTVRSTVFSGVGVFLTIGAGLFLAIWWVTHWRRSRRRPVRPATLAT